MLKKSIYLLCLLTSYAHASDTCKSLNIDLVIPCANEATRSLYKNKTTGLAFIGTHSFNVHSFDRLVIGSVDEKGQPSDQDVCMAEYTITQASKIDSILEGKVTPHATVAPSDGHWYHYSGVALGGTASYGVKAEFNADQCYVTYTLGNKRISVDEYAAHFSSKPLVTQSAEDRGVMDCENLLNAYDFSGGRAPTPDSMTRACTVAVHSIMPYVGRSEIECLWVSHEAYAFKCQDIDTKKVIVPIAVHVDPSGSMAEAMTPIVPVEALPVDEDLQRP